MGAFAPSCLRVNPVWSLGGDDFESWRTKTGPELAPRARLSCRESRALVKAGNLLLHAELLFLQAGQGGHVWHRSLTFLRYAGFDISVLRLQCRDMRLLHSHLLCLCLTMLTSPGPPCLLPFGRPTATVRRPVDELALLLSKARE